MFSTLNSNKKAGKLIVFCFFLFCFWFLMGIQTTANAETESQLLKTEVEYPRIPGVTAPQEINQNDADSQPFPLFMGYMFRLLLAGSIIVAFAVIFYGGVLYMLSQSNPERRNQAISWIKGAIQGALIMLFSHYILASIDSRFLIFKTGDLEKVPSQIGITLSDEVKDTYFQIPLGKIIEDLATNEVSRDRIYDALDAVYDAEDSARGITMGATDIIDIMSYCNVGSPCSGNQTLNTGGWPALTFQSITNLKATRHPMGCWWEENVTRSELSSEIEKPSMEKLDENIFDYGLVRIEDQKTLLNLSRIELEKVIRERTPFASENIRQKIDEIIEKSRNIINHQERTDNFTAESREITKIIYALIEEHPEIKDTDVQKVLLRMTNFSNTRSSLPKWDKGHSDIPYVEQSDIKWRHFRYGWTTIGMRGSLLASATMALQSLDTEITIFDALSFATQNNYQISPLEGTEFDFFEHIVRDYGFNYEGTTNVRLSDIDKIINWLENQKGPVVVEGVNLPWSAEPEIKHSIVLTGINKQQNILYINDPRNPFRNTIKIDDVKSNIPLSIGYSYNGETFKCGTPILYEGEEYGTVKIGSQCWMTKNMNFDNGCYRNQLVPNKRNGCGYYIDDNGKEVKEYGLLYQWDAAASICPDGWRLTTDNDWRILERELGMEDLTTSFIWRGVWRAAGDVGKKLKSTTGWINSGSGSDDYRFNALPGGFWRPRSLPEPDELGSPMNFGFNEIKEEGVWWASSLIKGGSHAAMRGLHSSQAGVKRSADRKDYAFSVRCALDIPTGREYIYPEDFFDPDNLDLDNENSCMQIGPAIRDKANKVENYNEKFYNDLIILHQSKKIIEENMYQLYRALALKSLGVNHIIDYSHLLSQKLEYKVSPRISTQSNLDFALLHRFNRNPSNPHSWNWQKWEDNTLYWIDKVIGEGDERVCVTSTVENDPVNFYLKTPEADNIIFDALIKLAHKDKQTGLQYIKTKNIAIKSQQKQAISNKKEDGFYNSFIVLLKKLVTSVNNKETYASSLPKTIEECIRFLNIDINNITQEDVDRIYSECDPSLTRIPGDNPEDYLTCKMEIPVGEIIDILWENYNEILYAIDGYIVEGLKLLEMQKDFATVTGSCYCRCLAGTCSINCDTTKINDEYYKKITTQRGKMRIITRYIHHLTNGFYWDPVINICDRRNTDVINREEVEMCKTINFFITKHELITRKLSYSRDKFNLCVVRPEQMEDVLEWGMVGTKSYFGPIVEKHDIPRKTKTIIGNMVQNTHEFNWFCCTDYEDF